MMIRYWQPISEIETIRRQMDRVFDEFTGKREDLNTPWMPATELIDVGESLLLKVQLPGLNSKDIDIQVTREAVLISGERQPEHNGQDLLHSEFRYGKFQRMIQLPVAIQNEEVKASYTDGLLTLTLPKVVEARNRVVKINLGELESANQIPSLEASTESQS